MDLDLFPTISEHLYLSELSPAFLALEDQQLDGLPEEERKEKRVWVVVRQANEEDQIKRAELQARREVKYSGLDDQGLTVSEVVDDNWRERVQYEVWWTLEDIGNLTRKGQDVFPKMPAKTVKWDDFVRVWGGLHPIVAQAIHAAVRKMNPDWDWRAK